MQVLCSFHLKLTKENRHDAESPYWFLNRLNNSIVLYIINVMLISTVMYGSVTTRNLIV
jgi:hypothetical protein